MKEKSVNAGVKVRWGVKQYPLSVSRSRPGKIQKWLKLQVVAKCL